MKDNIFVFYFSAIRAHNAKIYFLLALACVCFMACNNPIMEEWWVESIKEVVIEKEVIVEKEVEVEREVVIEREVEVVVEVPVEVEVVKDIKLLYINYIIFAPDSILYNQPAYPSGPDLSQQRKDLNNTIISEVKYIADQIDTTHANIRILVNGYSNPAIPPTDPNWENEVSDCQWVSNARAEEVTGELIFIGVDHNLITYDGYGGTQTVVTYNPGNLASAELNRRVEIIIFEIVQ